MAQQPVAPLRRGGLREVGGELLGAHPVPARGGVPSGGRHRGAYRSPRRAARRRAWNSACCSAVQRGGSGRSRGVAYGQSPGSSPSPWIWWRCARQPHAPPWMCSDGTQSTHSRVQGSSWPSPAASAGRARRRVTARCPAAAAPASRPAPTTSSRPASGAARARAAAGCRPAGSPSRSARAGHTGWRPTPRSSSRQPARAGVPGGGSQQPPGQPRVPQRRPGRQGQPQREQRVPRRRQPQHHRQHRGQPEREPGAA